jgi:DNA polymerase III delta prime subunit
MRISDHFNKDNLHHAYLLEGEKEELISQVIEFCQKLEIKTEGNPDFCHISVDSFKIEEAFDLRAMSANKNISSAKRVFLISVNSFTLDAQNVLLKMFEEPVSNTHFFVVTPDADALLKTFISRFYFIPFSNKKKNTNEAEIFIKKDKKGRIDFIKELLAKEEDPGESNEESARSKAMKFLNALEFVLYQKMSRTVLDISMFKHFFKVREFLRMPGSSAKNLLESIALTIPVDKSRGVGHLQK